MPSFACTSAPCASSAATAAPRPVKAAEWSGVSLRCNALAHTPHAGGSRVHVGAVREQRRHNVRVPVESGVMERRPPAAERARAHTAARAVGACQWERARACVNLRARVILCASARMCDVWMCVHVRTHTHTHTCECVSGCQRAGGFVCLCACLCAMFDRINTAPLMCACRNAWIDERRGR